MHTQYCLEELNIEIPSGSLSTDILYQLNSWQILKEGYVTMNEWIFHSVSKSVNQSASQQRAVSYAVSLPCSPVSVSHVTSQVASHLGK
jgi:hypothetical protein